MGKKNENLERFEKIAFSRVPKFITLPMENLIGKTLSELQKDIDCGFQNKYGNDITKSNFSVRSSGSISTPGRMKTILDSDINSVGEDLAKVYRSTQSDRLKTYLEMKGVDDFKVDIIIQEMVYGNKNKKSCSGVLLTKNPFTSDFTKGFKVDDEPYIEFIQQSTGDKIMSGDITPQTDLKSFNEKGYQKLMEQINMISKEFPYICEVEFVIEQKIGTTVEAYILQIREYKTNSSLSFVNLSGLRLETIGQGSTVIQHSCKGIVTYDIDNLSKDKILITDTTEWDNTKKLLDGGGLITLNGGRLSHAASISKEFYLPCVVGANFLEKPKEGDEIIFTGKGEICKLYKENKN